MDPCQKASDWSPDAPIENRGGGGGKRERREEEERRRNRRVWRRKACKCTCNPEGYIC